MTKTHTIPYGLNTNTNSFQLLLGSPKMCKQKPKKQFDTDKNPSHNMLLFH